MLCDVPKRLPSVCSMMDDFWWVKLGASSEGGLGPAPLCAGANQRRCQPTSMNLCSDSLAPPAQRPMHSVSHPSLPYKGTVRITPAAMADPGPGAHPTPHTCSTLTLTLALTPPLTPAAL